MKGVRKLDIFPRWICSWYLLYNTEPAVNNTVLCISEFVKKVDIMLSVLTTHRNTDTHTHTHTKTIKRTQGNSGKCWI